MTSPQDEKPHTGNFTELSETECKELLRQHAVGRVGFMAGEGPQILPVTYQYRAGSVIFRSGVDSISTPRGSTSFLSSAAMPCASCSRSEV